MAPIEGGGQRLVPRRGCAPAMEGIELTVEQRSGAFDSVYANSAGGEFHGERDAIEAPAQAGDDRSFPITELQRAAARFDLFDEQLHGWEAQCPHRGQRYGIPRRTFERRQMMDPFALGPQRLPARDQNVDLRGVTEQFLRQCSHRFDEVLAAVEQQQHAPLAQQCEDSWNRILRNDGEPKLGGERSRHQLLILDGREVKEMDVPGEL
jgi:hypothetical protein